MLEQCKLGAANAVFNALATSRRGSLMWSSKHGVVNIGRAAPAASPHRRSRHTTLFLLRRLPFLRLKGARRGGEHVSKDYLGGGKSLPTPTRAPTARRPGVAPKAKLKYIRSGKRYDRVSSEMLRGGGGMMASLLYQLFNKCWKSHKVPNDWCKAVIVPLYKGKGSRQFVVLPWLFNLFMDSCPYDLKEYECGLRMDELSVKCLLYADDQIILAPSVCGLQDMVNKTNDSLKKVSMKLNVGGKKQKVDAEGRQFQQKWTEEFFFYLAQCFESFPIALDESTDLSDTAQLAIFIRAVDKEFTVTEELLVLQPLKGITTEEDIFDEVQKVFTSFCLPWSKLA
ncbi:General transcription factor II-I repeat domain-containing protein 2A [Eumeta japonica]|uniref:General transcription factor II-I repeat domain-containing protein 2A n=1 Tax=Eumeta variegata TaxID=151549 RepID=A0A4C1YWK5_EUMVA|nr:General transcription factor II-I repeat domain-containing protein 2A [Eumeta japonica]